MELTMTRLSMQQKYDQVMGCAQKAHAVCSPGNVRNCALLPSLCGA